MLQSVQGALSGTFPVWNPYQFMGVPTATDGIYALTYPFTYCAYFVAHFLLRNDYNTLEVFSGFHLLAGYVVTYFVLRRMGSSSLMAATGACCWILSGWFLVAGRSQYTFIPLAVYLPLLILSAHLFNRSELGWRWALWTGAVIGLFFHSGHAEMWVYSLSFDGAALLLSIAFGSKDRKKRIIWAAAAISIGLAIAAPLLVLQRMELDRGERMGRWTWTSSIPHMLLPFGSWIRTEMYMGSKGYENSGEIYYAGTLFTSVSLVLILFWLSNCIARKGLLRAQWMKENIWLICGGVAFLLSLGSSAGLWRLISMVPPFDKFRWAIKYTPYFQLFFICGGAAVLERLLPRKQKIDALIFACVSALLLYHVTQCVSTWYTFTDRTYAPLPLRMHKLISGGGRIYPAASFRSVAPEYVQSLALNFPTHYGVLSFMGYDNFVEGSPPFALCRKFLIKDPITAAKIYGVRWLLWSYTLDQQILSGNPLETANIEIIDDTVPLAVMKLRGSLQPVFTSNAVKIYDLGAVSPIVFRRDNATVELPYKLNQSGIVVDTRNLERSQALTVNFLYRPWLTASCNGIQLPIRADQWGRIEVDFKAPAPTMEVRYSPPWPLSSSIAMVLALFGGIFGLIAQRTQGSDSGKASM